MCLCKLQVPFRCVSNCQPQPDIWDKPLEGESTPAQTHGWSEHSGRQIPHWTNIPEGKFHIGQTPSHELQPTGRNNNLKSSSTELNPQDTSSYLSLRSHRGIARDTSIPNVLSFLTGNLLKGIKMHFLLRWGTGIRGSWAYSCLDRSHGNT